MAVMMCGMLFSAHASTDSQTHKAQDKLHHLDQKIITLKQQLDEAQSRQDGMEQLLAVQDKKMSDLVHDLNHSSKTMQENQTKIQVLSQEASQLSSHFKIQPIFSTPSTVSNRCNLLPHVDPLALMLKERLIIAI